MDWGIRLAGEAGNGCLKRGEMGNGKRGKGKWGRRPPITVGWTVQHSTVQYSTVGVLSI